MSLLKAYNFKYLIMIILVCCFTGEQIDEIDLYVE